MIRANWMPCDIKEPAEKMIVWVVVELKNNEGGFGGFSVQLAQYMGKGEYTVVRTKAGRYQAGFGRRVCWAYVEERPKPPALIYDESCEGWTMMPDGFAEMIFE